MSVNLLKRNTNTAVVAKLQRGTVTHHHVYYVATFTNAIMTIIISIKGLDMSFLLAAGKKQTLRVFLINE